MDMKRSFETALSALHAEFLKPIGFRKSGHTLSRAMEGYHERFNFQGSSWNGSGLKWRFYLNCGIEFPDLPPERLWSYFPHTHWAGRVGQLLPDAPPHWEYGPEADATVITQDLQERILAASSELRRRAPALRTEYLERIAQRTRRPTDA